MKFGTTDVRMAQCLIREVCGLALMPDEHDRRVTELLKLPENLLQACFEALVGPRTVVTGEDVGFKDGWYIYGHNNPAHYFKDRKSLCNPNTPYDSDPKEWGLCEPYGGQVPRFSCGVCRDALASREDATPAPSNKLEDGWYRDTSIGGTNNPHYVLDGYTLCGLDFRERSLANVGPAPDMPCAMCRACLATRPGNEPSVTLKDGWWRNPQVSRSAHFFQGEIALCSLDKGDDLGWLPCDPHGLAQDQICNTCADKLKKPERVGDAVHDALREALPSEPPPKPTEDGWWQTSSGGPVHAFKDGHALCDHSIVSYGVLRFTDVPDGACAACLLRMELPAPTPRPDMVEAPKWFSEKYGGVAWSPRTIYNLLMDLAQILHPHREDAERG